MSGESAIRRRMRIIIDAVYGAKEWRGAYIYLACLWVPALILLLLLTGLTPWSWPAVRESRVASLAPVSCEWLLEESAASSLDLTGQNQAATATGARSGCRRQLGQATREQLDRVEGTIAFLQQGGPTPAALNLPDDAPLRSWVNGNICRLGGADAADRGALAWQVNAGVGECGDFTRRAANFPLSIWTGWWPGTLLTPFILLILFFFLLRHTLRLRSTRRAYRRLFGSEHKAD